MNIINIRGKSFEKSIIESSKNKILGLAKIFFNLKETNYPFLVTKNINHYTVLKSPHVHKKSREQFKLETYNSMLSIKLPESVSLLLIKDFIDYIKLENLSSSITITIIEKNYSTEIKK